MTSHCVELDRIICQCHGAHVFVFFCFVSVNAMEHTFLFFWFVVLLYNYALVVPLDYPMPSLPCASCHGFPRWCFTRRGECQSGRLKVFTDWCQHCSTTVSKLVEHAKGVWKVVGRRVDGTWQREHGRRCRGGCG